MEKRYFVNSAIQVAVLTAAVFLVFIFSSCGAGTDVKRQFTISGFVTTSRGGPPVAGSRLTITEAATTTKIASTTTAADGSYSLTLPAGRYCITAKKTDFADSRVENVLIGEGQRLFNVNLIQFPVFNDNWETGAPNVTVTGISDETLVQGQVLNIRVNASGVNPTRLIAVRIGNLTSTPDFQAPDTDLIDISWNSAQIIPPPSESYLHISVYDVNFNRTERFIHFRTPAGIERVLPAPEKAFAFAHTFPQDLQIFAKHQHSAYNRINKEFDPNYIELSEGSRLDLREVPPDTTIVNNLHWEQVNGAAGYKVYRSDAAGSFRLIGDTAVGTFTRFFDYSPELTPGVTYQYSIEAYNSGGVGAPALTPPVTVLDRFEVILESPANGAAAVPVNPLFQWRVISSAGKRQRYEIGVIGLNDSAYSWRVKFFDLTSIQSGITLQNNKAYEWDLITCEGVGDWNSEASDYLARSFASPAGNSTGGSFIFATEP
jgi:hypothetical protein